jgi:hypothetical protein
MCIGAIPDITVEDAWKSEKLMEMRKIHNRGEVHTIKGCLDCPLRSAQIKK